MSDHGNPVQYEKTDIEIGAVVKAGLAILVITVVTAFALVPVVKFLKARSEKGDPPAAPIAGFGPDRKPPGPLLQERPFDDWRALKRQQDERLGTYGWVDESKGVARIPIDEAMKRLAEKGLPARPAPVAATVPSAGATSAPAPPVPAHDAPTEHHP